jgi:hypothetical protein
MIAGCSVWAVQATRRLTTIAIGIFYVIDDIWHACRPCFFILFFRKKLVGIYSLSLCVINHIYSILHADGYANSNVIYICTKLNFLDFGGVAYVIYKKIYITRN